MAKGKLDEAFYKLGRLDESMQFVPEPVECLPMEPEMKGVYFNDREREPIDRYFYIAGVMESNGDVDPWWTVLTGYFSLEETIPMQDHRLAEMERLRNEQQ